MKNGMGHENNNGTYIYIHNKDVYNFMGSWGSNDIVDVFHIMGYIRMGCFTGLFEYFLDVYDPIFQRIME